MELIEAIKNRRSIRKYKNKQVPDEILKQIMETARWAPSWKNTQCWRFIIVQDVPTKEKLKETLTQGNRGKEAIMSAPILIVACGKKGLSGYINEQIATNKGDWFMFDVALALANITLTAHSFGMGTLHIGAFDAEKAEKILALPKDMTIVELMSLGYPDENPNAPTRKELTEIIQNNI